MKQKPRTFAVIGLGTFGSTVATELQRFGNYVIGIDSSETNTARLSAELSQAIILDARDETALREAGLGDCDVAIIAIGEDLEANVLAAINAKMIGVKVVWAKAISRTHHRILSKIGVDRVIHPEQDVGQHIAQVLHNPYVRDYVGLGNGFHIVNFVVSPALQGKNLASLDLSDKFDLRCLGVMRGTDYICGPDGDCVLEEDDYLILLGRRTELREFGASL